MKARKPLTDESGEVRELLLEDLRGFRPAADALAPALAAKLGIESRQGEEPLAVLADAVRPLARNQAEARKIAGKHYPFRCCVVCGLQIQTCLTVAHLDHEAGNNEPDNLAWLCWTHHWMFDANLYPIEAIKLMRGRWQETKGVPSRVGATAAAKKAVRTRQRSAAARKAWQSRRRSLG